MLYYVFIRYIDKKGKQAAVRFNLSEETVEKTVANPIKQNKRFIFVGRPIHPSGIDTIDIYKSNKDYRKLILPNGKRALDSEFDYVIKCFAHGEVEGVEVCTTDFIVLLEEEKPTKAPVKKKEFFIVHGRDDRQALLLQKYLKNKLKIDAVVFDDLPDKGRTIIEQLEYIKGNVCYAFVIVTPDDLGCLRDDMEKWTNKLWGRKTVSGKTVEKILGTLHTRARQNVVFELGLFIGALGRENVCCLLQKDTEEKPSDIDGILYKSFDKSVREIFHEIADELK